MNLLTAYEYGVVLGGLLGIAFTWNSAVLYIKRAKTVFDGEKSEFEQTIRDLRKSLSIKTENARIIAHQLATDGYEAISDLYRVWETFGKNHDVSGFLVGVEKKKPYTWHSKLPFHFRFNARVLKYLREMEREREGK